MPPRKTRNTQPAASNGEDSGLEAPKLSARDEQPAKIIILPKAASPEARIVSLSNPSNGRLSRYLYCPKAGFYEFTQVSSKEAARQSCLLVSKPLERHQSKNTQTSREDADETHHDPKLGSGYVIEDAQFLIATPMDPTLLMIPLFKPGMVDERGRPHRARMMDDLLEELGTTSKHMKMLLRYPSVQKVFDKALDSVCECMNAMGEVLNRPESTLLLGHLVAKARRMVGEAWPASLEKHVQKRLEVPAAITVMRHSQETQLSHESPPTNAEDEKEDEPKEKNERSNNVGANASLQPSEDVIQQLRLRTALDFIFSSYVPKPLKEYFEKIVSSPNQDLVDFEAMKAHLELVESLKSEAQALRSISNNVSRKRSAEDEELQDARNEKRRKKEEEEKKRKQESRATKDLKKVNTSGMQKLSSFFSKSAGSTG